MPLPEGVYEHLVTEALARELADVAPAQPILEELTDRDLDHHAEIARLVAREVERALAALPAGRRLHQAQALLTSLLERIAEHSGEAERRAAVREQRLEPPVRRLLALHRGEVPPRPSSPLAISTLLTRNRNEPSLAHELACEIATADRIDALVAFVTMGGVRALAGALEAFARRQPADVAPRLRLLTTAFTGTTEVAALDLLARLPGVQVKVSYDVRRTRLHAKAWLFTRRSGLHTAYIGSANLTHTGIGTGREWTVKATAADLPLVLQQFQGTFDTLWADPEFEDYQPEDERCRHRLAEALAVQTAGAAPRLTLLTLRPFSHQQQILDRLAAERSVHGRRRNLVVAATGTGKTVIAAFDYAQVAAARGVTPNLLFLAHRRELVEQARDTFRHVLADAAFGELLVGGQQPRTFEHVFATIQSVSASGLLERLGPEHFGHVIIDECHHLPAASYQSVVQRLRPELLVGLTATPERTDGKSLLPDFGGRLAAELRLWDALEDQLLVPFEYYGISDQVDLRRTRWTRSGYDAAGLEQLYTGNQARAHLVHRQLARRVSEVRRVRALGFCVSVEHARYMAAQFAAAGVPALALSGEASDEERAAARRRLEARELNVIFTCDLYNEGVDLPFVDTLLLLRPTASATLFLQQLGRGLRLAPGKAGCLVLDFIGQHRQEFRFDATLSALSGVARARLARALEDGFPYLPSGCVLQLDAVARAQILASLRASLTGAAALAEELRELSRDGVPRLARYLQDTGREVSEVYERAGGWSALKARAGLLPADARRDGLSARLGRLLHVDEAARLTSYRSALLGERLEDDTLRRRLLMLEAQLHPTGSLRAAEQTVEYLTGTAGIPAELEELVEVLGDRIELPMESYPVREWPLALHRHYTRHEINAAVGRARPGKSTGVPQGGVLGVGDQRELLFVTLDKTGRGFSPTTRFRDYAISPARFHWETQSAVRAARTGRRYLENPGNGWSFYLFVRVDSETPFAFLGPVTYVEHTGDRPIAITWQLATPMPATLYARFATLRPD